MPRSLLSSWTLLAAIAGLLLATVLPGRALGQPIEPSLSNNRITAVSSAYSGFGDGYGPGSRLVAYGVFLKLRQEAELIREEVRQRKLETRKQKLELWAWEAQFTLEVIEGHRNRVRQLQVRNAVNASDPEVYSGGSLNTILDDLKKTGLSTEGSVPIDHTLLPHIHSSIHNGGGNLGLLKANKIHWPMLLATEQDFAADCRNIDSQLAQLRKQAFEGNVSMIQLRDLQERVTTLQKQLRSAQTTRPIPYSFREYTDSKNFLMQVEDAIKLLQRPDARDYMADLRGTTVAELVNYMKTNGFSFGPATQADQRYYKVLHQAMAEEWRRSNPDMQK